MTKREGPLPEDTLRALCVNTKKHLIDIDCVLDIIQGSSNETCVENDETRIKEAILDELERLVVSNENLSLGILSRINSLQDKL